MLMIPVTEFRNTWITPKAKMVSQKEINLVIDKYKESGTILDIRSDVVVGYQSVDCVFHANKIGDFWYIRKDTEKHYEAI